MSQHKLSPNQEEVLSHTVISSETPGTILHDFQVLLDFLTKGSQQLTEAKMLPLNVLQLLNERLKRRIKHGLIRAPQKSYPHIHGLLWLLQSTGLAMVDAHTCKPQLVIDYQLVDSWNGLTAEERYFSLLEGYLWRWYPAITGDSHNSFGFIYPFTAWHNFFLQFDNNDWQGKKWMARIRYWPQAYLLALMELFGFLIIEDAPTLSGKGWQIADIRTTAWGESLLALLDPLLLDDDFNKRLIILHDSQPGELQPLLQPYQPRWRQTLQMPEAGYQNGLYVFKVSLGFKLWRQITIPAQKTLHDFSKAILAAYQFDHEHLYCFKYDYHNDLMLYGRLTKIVHPSMDKQQLADTIRIGEMLVKTGFQMILHYDFEENWIFHILLERIDLPDSSIQEYQITKRYGPPPKQYI